MYEIKRRKHPGTREKWAALAFLGLLVLIVCFAFSGGCRSKKKVSAGTEANPSVAETKAEASSAGAEGSFAGAGTSSAGVEGSFAGAGTSSAEAEGPLSEAEKSLADNVGQEGLPQAEANGKDSLVLVDSSGQTQAVWGKKTETWPAQVQPAQIQPSQAQPSQVQPAQAQPSQIQPSQPQSQPRPVQREGFLVMLDPGHGGKDPGTMGGGINEKDVNLAICKKIRACLEEKGCTVEMTREGDSYPTLSDRVRAASDCNADVFVSIHQNAVENSTDVSGIETYCNTVANSRSSELAELIQDALIEATGARDRGVITNSDFYVVHHNTMPSCLVETGFLTTASERALLVDDGYQDKIARAVADAVWDFLNNE